MKKYIKTAVIEVVEVTNDGDYLVQNENKPDDRWVIPKDTFESTYRELPDMFDIGSAIFLAKVGEKIARKGWNGKGMFVVYQKGYPQGIPSNKQTAEAWGLNEGDLFICNPYLQIRNPDGSHSMWQPSGSDALAEDWYVVTDEVKV